MSPRKRRRSFPRWLLFLLIFMIGGWSVLVVTGYLFVQNGWGSGNYQPVNSNECREVSSRYGIEIVTPDGKVSIRYPVGNIRGETIDREALDVFAALLAEEFCIYPVDLVKKSKLRKIVLCSNLSVNSDPVGGVPDFHRGLLFVEASYAIGDPLYCRKTLHHEFFHIIDFRDDGDVEHDPKWEALNQPGFRYGRGGLSAVRDPDSLTFTEQYPGFLNHYSTTGVEEDKAEMYSNMIVEPEYVELRARKDPIIRAKVVMMKQLMKRFCPEIDDAFWTRVENMKRIDP